MSTLKNEKYLGTFENRKHGNRRKYFSRVRIFDGAGYPRKICEKGSGKILDDPCCQIIRGKQVGKLVLKCM